MIQNRVFWVLFLIEQVQEDYFLRVQEIVNGDVFDDEVFATKGMLEAKKRK